MRKNTYPYDGKDFSSIRELAEYVGINEKTLTARLRRGLSVEAACNTLDFRCVYFEDKGDRKSVTQICKEQAKDVVLIRNRLKYGYSLNDALNKPKKVSRQGIPIVVNGILYNSIAAALKKMNMSDKESTVRRRLKMGMKPEEAFYFEDRNMGQM